MKPSVWKAVRTLTQARIGLERTGHALSTKELLAFQLAHAEARDAIHLPWNQKQLEEALHAAGLPTQTLQTQIKTREEYLKRPDLGRKLAPDSIDLLHASQSLKAPDITLVVSNGLSSVAAENHALPMVLEFTKWAQNNNLTVSPIYLVENARVALSDSIGACTKSQLLWMLIGERPGLSSPNSLGAYLTYQPTIGKTDADRNCISNIRPPHGLRYIQAVDKMAFLTLESLRTKNSGVQLKDLSETDSMNLSETGPTSLSETGSIFLEHR